MQALTAPEKLFSAQIEAIYEQNDKSSKQSLLIKSAKKMFDGNIFLLEVFSCKKIVGDAIFQIERYSAKKRDGKRIEALRLHFVWGCHLLWCNYCAFQIPKVNTGPVTSISAESGCKINVLIWIYFLNSWNPDLVPWIIMKRECGIPNHESTIMTSQLNVPAT